MSKLVDLDKVFFIMSRFNGLSQRQYRNKIKRVVMMLEQFDNDPNKLVDDAKESNNPSLKKGDQFDPSYSYFDKY